MSHPPFALAESRPVKLAREAVLLRLVRPGHEHDSRS
jgi:hypothetical protein